ncbi:uncharacterized protein LOC111699533 isoform X1 [Eurytemora carolleeae]|uniref:uncharacterized protein LOC111699533 isoform X1 n=1 Tax=Eurytemora carolleeae TaxID=1294199 RepID=UPI000C77A5E1|nr:uncharacterized protein LOC111699533 isoform X1 [Eurytemora carolleeae]|eukprot:XP_023325996.1 uncharacterized protein LOC111699533 isoform X1 [Eurytemora affinis]
MLSLRGPEFDEKPRDGKLPPIKQEDDRLFSMAESNYDDYDTRTESRLSLSSADSMKSSRLPNIESDRDDSASSVNTQDSVVSSLPPINSHKSRQLFKTRSLSTADGVHGEHKLRTRISREEPKSNSSPPGSRISRTSSTIPRKSSVYSRNPSDPVRKRRKPSQKNIDPFENIGIRMER